MLQVRWNLVTNLIMKKTIITTTASALVIFLCYLFWSSKNKKNDVMQKPQQENQSSKTLASEQALLKKQQKEYDNLSLKEKTSRMNNGYLQPFQVDPKVHTELGHNNRYLEKIEINEEKFQKVKALVMQIEHESKMKYDEYKAELRENPHITPHPWFSEGFTKRGHENTHIQTPKQAYQHLVKHGRSSFNQSYPVKYIEDDDYYIFSHINPKTGSAVDFTDGIAVAKKGGLIMRWRLNEE